MTYVIPYILVLFIVVPVGGRGNSMPYGDYPHWHSAYGICKESIEPKDAEIAIQRYFAFRGLRAENMRHGDRFTVADIYKGNQLFDKIIFDRKTGRIRSIY